MIEKENKFLETVTALFFTFFILLLLNSFFLKKIYAQLTINEIYPAPPLGEDEWLELFNNSDSIIDLSNYHLYDLANNKIKIDANIVMPYQFVIATSSSILNNSGDTVFLKNNAGEVIEIATYSGTFTTSKTFAKCPDGIGSWYILNSPTKNISNKESCLILTPSPTPSPTITPTSTIFLTPTITITPALTPASTLNPIPTPTYSPTPTNQISVISYDKVYLSETMPYPETGEKEWVEIYNDNDFDVYLQNWFIDDIENAGSAPKTFSLIIGTKSYGLIELSSSIFNNNGDSVRLLDFNKNLKDSFEYSDAVKNKTFGRVSFENDDFCLQEPSKGYNNNPCINPTHSPTPTITNFPSPSKASSPPKIPTPTKSYFISQNDYQKTSNIIQKEMRSSIVPNKNFSQKNNLNNQVLGAADINSFDEDINSKDQFQSKEVNYLKSFSFSSFGISLLNLCYLIIKILKKIPVDS